MILDSIIITMKNTDSFSVGELITFYGYDRSFLSTILYKFLGITPPTLRITLRVEKRIGLSQVALSKVEVSYV